MTDTPEPPPTDRISSILPGPARPGACPPLVYIGDDGEWLAALGHLDRRLMVCLAIAALARDVGTVDETVEQYLLPEMQWDHLVGCVGHRWVVELVHPRQGGTVGEESLWWRHPETDELVTEVTPGAFAITTFDTGA